MKAKRPKGFLWWRKRKYEGEPDRLFPKVLFHVRRKKTKLFTKFIYRILKSLDRAGVTGERSLRIVSKFSSHTKVFSLICYSEVGDAIVTCSGPSSCTIVPPCTLNGLKQPITQLFPGIQAREFRDMVGMSGSSALLSAEKICVPSQYIESTNTDIADGKFLCWTGKHRVGLISLTQPQFHDEGIMLFGAGSSNWYHWLIETLPAAFLSKHLPEKYSKFPFIVPKEILDLPTFQESLDIFRDGRDVISLGAGTHRFASLIQVDNLVREPINLRHGHWPNGSYYSYDRRLLCEYRSEILKSLSINDDRHEDLIFLARNSSLRVYNQDEVIYLAKRSGFRVVYLEEMSFREQVKTLNSAKFVIGPSGAAFANTLFCQSGTRLLSWLHPKYNGFCSFANISHAVGASMRYLYVKSNMDINSTYEGHGASYKIDIEEFDTALRILLNSRNY